MLARHILISCMLSMWKPCTVGLTCNGSNVSLHSKWDLFLYACFLLFPELFFFHNPSWLQQRLKQKVFLFFYLFPHICGFLVNQRLQLYQELIKDFTQICCRPAHGLHMQWTFMESICLEKKVSILDSYWPSSGPC